MKKQYKIKIISAILFLIVVAALRFFHIGHYINLSYIHLHQESVKMFIQNHYIGAVLFYMALYILIVLAMMPITLILNIAAGYFFGVTLGTLYSVLSATIGAVCSFLMFRYLIKDSFGHKYKKTLQRFKDNVQKNGIFYLLSLQLFPITPFPVINICAAFAGVSLFTFIWTTAVGITPGTILYTWAGKELESIKSIQEIVSWPFITLFVLLSAIALMPLLLKKFNIKLHH